MKTETTDIEALRRRAMTVRVVGCVSKKATPISFSAVCTELLAPLGVGIAVGGAVIVILFFVFMFAFGFLLVSASGF